MNAEIHYIIWERLPNFKRIAKFKQLVEIAIFGDFFKRTAYFKLFLTIKKFKKIFQKYA